MRLPGTVAEVEASPEGPEIGAFFDFDGTIIAGHSAVIMAGDRFRRREISLGEISRTVGASLQTGVGRADFLRLTARGWAGRTHEDMEELGRRLYVERLVDLVYPEARALVSAHLRRGHTVVLTTSATRYQVDAAAADLGIEEILCTELTVADGILTGDLTGAALWGTGKSDAVQRLAAERGIDLARSYFYADGDEDVALMHLVGNPRPTNPGRQLEQVARRRGWPVLRLTGRERPSVPARLRTLAGAMTLAPIAAVTGAVGVLRRDRHGAEGTAARTWATSLLTAGGVSVRLVEDGAAPSPAVLVHEGRAALDNVAVVAVAGTLDVLDAGASNPVTDALTRLVGVDAAGALASLAAGRSVLSADLTAAAGLAVAAGAPLVPVALRGTDQLWGRDDTVVRGGDVEVVLLAPVSVDGRTPVQVARTTRTRFRRARAL